MRRYLGSVSFVLFFFACAMPVKNQYASFGDPVKDVDVITLRKAIDALGSSDSMIVKINAEIVEVCQNKGCWMKLENKNGDDVRVTFKDYGFFVPKDAGGKKAIIEGVLKKTILSSEMAKHYAEDAGVAYDSLKEYSEYSIVSHGVLIEVNQETE